MCSSTTSTPSFSLLLTNAHSLSPRRHRSFPFISPITFLTHYSLTNNTPNYISSAIADNKPSNFSWVLTDDDNDDFGGWAISETPIPRKKKGFPTFWVAGIGTSIALLVSAFILFKLSKNGFRLPFRSSTPVTSVEVVDVEVEETKLTDSDAPAEESEVSEKPEVDSYDEVTKSMSSEYPQPRVVNVIVDSNQKEAMQTLQKLKILDEDVHANELCTRREYARWLVRASSLLERNPKYKVTTPAALSGSVITAYEDVTIGDPDFDFIQAIAEAGVTPSKLSSKHKSDGGFNFHPESYLSRRDLIEWRSQLEYDYTTTGNQEILKRKLDLMDVRETSFNEWPGLFMDMLAGDRSLLRRVFGQIKRLQPNKPTTVAQASVALTSGRMIEAIQSELLRMQGEEASRKAAKEEIKQELLDRGEIKKFWDEKMEEEKNRDVKVQQFYGDACNLLEEEKIVQEGALNGLLKEKAAMDCQKQLLEGLKEDVNEMSERLVSERNQLISEEETVQTLRSDLLTRKEGILDAKSLLEAEIEALRILRSWIEDEARKSEARSKVLAEVGRRWKWESQ